MKNLREQRWCHAFFGGNKDAKIWAVSELYHVGIKVILE